jgi:hypothetical protein
MDDSTGRIDRLSGLVVITEKKEKVRGEPRTSIAWKLEIRRS